jgi:hypothetical protein
VVCVVVVEHTEAAGSLSRQLAAREGSTRGPRPSTCHYKIAVLCYSISLESEAEAVASRLHHWPFLAAAAAVLALQQ